MPTPVASEVAAVVTRLDTAVVASAAASAAPKVIHLRTPEVWGEDLWVNKDKDPT